MLFDTFKDQLSFLTVSPLPDV